MPECEPESQDVKTGPFTYKPTAAEVELHRLTHWPCRSWCEWCIKGKAIGEQHVRSTRVSDVPVVAADYFFLTSGEGDIGVNVKLRSEIDMDDSTMDAERREGRLVKCLIFRCHMSKAVFTWAVPYKGDGEDGYVTGLVATALKWLAYTRVIIKCDNEPALVALMRSATQLAKVDLDNLRQIGEEHPTPYDSQANGAVETGVRTARADIRTMRSDLGSRLKAQVRIDHPIMSWLVRHVGFTFTASVKGPDGRTPWERVRGRPYGQRLYHFGERVHWKMPAKGPRAQPRGNASDRWQSGVYLGNEYESNSYIVSLGDTTISSRAVMRFPDAERWSRETVEAITAHPWTGHERAEREPRVTFADIQRPVRDPVVEQPKSLRRFRINPTDIDRFGATAGCPQCDHMIQYGEARRGITHSDPCRARISASLMATPDGRMRLEGHEE